MIFQKEVNFVLGSASLHNATFEMFLPFRYSIHCGKFGITVVVVFVSFFRFLFKEWLFDSLKELAAEIACYGKNFALPGQ